jgi:Lhr-like helicase
VSEGVLFPKYRADLVACAAVTRAMHEGAIESTRYPRNPLDVLAQQMVAIVAHPPGVTKTKRRKSAPGTIQPPEPMPEVHVDALFNLVRRAAPFAALTREAFEGVLDLMSGRYPSDEFAELRPRLNWDRVANTVTAREGAARLAILNAGTIPDRGLYGVFLAFSEGKAVRVGELDEEMVFESHPGENFILGASTWRIMDITHDRVLVSPAPGEPGKMPFWKGAAQAGGADVPCCRARSGSWGGRESARVLGRSTSCNRCGPGRPHDCGGALQGRAGRLAGLRADAIWRTDSYSLGDGGERAHPRGGWAGCGNAVERRRLCAALSGHR